MSRSDLTEGGSGDSEKARCACAEVVSSAAPPIKAAREGHEVHQLQYLARLAALGDAILVCARETH
jgi:hypothetical protein